MKALQVIESAYRGTLEEQDDTVVWITHAMKGAGADLDVLLTGNAVNYAVAAQEVPNLSFGMHRQKHAPDIAGSVAGLLDKGVAVYFVSEDAVDRGLAGKDLIEGLTPVTRAGAAALYRDYDQIWNW
ncbi:MAG: DsrE family protein [Sphingomonadales bacterium]